jgi:5-(carboxyamino)imidazole ribonucleotide synthase
MTINRVGIIGGGQLAWMMGKAAETLGIELIVQTPYRDDPAVNIATEAILASIDDEVATARLASRCDVITFENEFVNLEALRPLARQGVCFRPSLETLAPLLDKYQQRRYLKDIGLPVPRFVALESLAPSPSALQPSSSKHLLGFPVVLKACRHGYDGQGTFVVDNQDDLDSTCQKLKSTPLLLEEFIPFERELAVIVARSVTGEIAIYPIVETQQENQVCRRVIIPANIALEIRLKIEKMARHLLEQLQAVGVFGLELFLTHEGKLLINEIAPRTHNSGHYTLDACETSQFEMQLRAVTGLPLGSTALITSGAVMVNLLGYETSRHDYQEKRNQLATIPHAYVHWYGKTESRLGRKLGHVTVLLEKAEQESSQIFQTISRIESLWYPQSNKA